MPRVLAWWLFYRADAVRHALPEDYMKWMEEFKSSTPLGIYTELCGIDEFKQQYPSLELASLNWK